MGHKASPFHSSGGKVGGIALRLSSFHNRPLAPAGGRFVFRPQFAAALAASPKALLSRRSFQDCFAFLRYTSRV